MFIELTPITQVIVPAKEGHFSDDWSNRYDKYDLESYIRNIIDNELKERQIIG